MWLKFSPAVALEKATVVAQTPAGAALAKPGVIIETRFVTSHDVAIFFSGGPA